MNVHDWTRVPDRVFHDFHGSWITHLKEALNSGILPEEFVARSEQRYSGRTADVIEFRRADAAPLPPTGGVGGGPVAVAVTPPRSQRAKTIRPGTRSRQRSIVVRRTGSEDIVAVIEVVSAANQDRPEHVDAFVGKVGDTLRAGIHMVVLDLLPPTRHVSAGMHVAIHEELDAEVSAEDVQPEGTPIALLSYASDPPNVQAFTSFLKAGDAFAGIPLFLTAGHYIELPLATAYANAVRGLGPADRRLLDPS